MITSMSSFGKGRVCGSLKLAKGQPHVSLYHPKQYSNAAATATATATNGAGTGNGNGNSKPKVQDAEMQRQLFMNVLEANATKRDAKQYLARFRPPKIKPDIPESAKIQQQRNARHRHDQDRLDRLGVNLGGLYTPARAIADTPVFTQHDIVEKALAAQRQEIHVACVLFRAVETCDDATLDGVALTLSQLVKLDMSIAIVLDCGGDFADANTARAALAVQADRLRAALEMHSAEGARLVHGAVELPDYGEMHADTSQSVSIGVPSLIMEPLKRGIIPIVPALAYSQLGKLTQVAASGVMTALTKQFAGVDRTGNGDGNDTHDRTSLDRVIILDPSGGIPSKARGDGAHIFINLQQEYDNIKKELSLASVQEAAIDEPIQNYAQHIDNLQVTQTCLSMLPNASSAVIITPQEAASSSRAREADDEVVGAGTRKQKNPLIHNLLTNKPMVSSSLPAARLNATSDSFGQSAIDKMPAATLVKRGMPLTIVPAADRSIGWAVPKSGMTTLDLEQDSRVDFARLLYLIEDSFRRKLDVHHYLDRINGSIAGLIVAGEYEGGAILTWETPASLQHLPASHPERAKRLVPYLDKFAVLQTSQGSAGVADILFQAMVRTCFPHGVCWRSRKDNPVNKWYFERAAGSWQIPDTNWTMFWTGDGVVDDEIKFADYVEVCRHVQPSWADGKKPD